MFTLSDSTQYNAKDLYDLRDQLLQIRSTMNDGKLPDEAGQASSGQDLVVPLLNRCLKFCEMMEEKYVDHPRNGKVC